MKYKIQMATDGIFQKLVQDDDVKFGQLSILTVYPGCSSGGHYHKRKVEWICCIKRTGLLEVINIEDNSKKIHLLNGFTNRVFIEVLPGFAHTIVNRDKYSDLEVLIITSEKFNSDDPDTFKYEESLN